MSLLWFFLSLVWGDNLNKEITSNDSEEQPLSSIVLSSCDTYFLPFSVVILEVACLSACFFSWSHEYFTT